MSFEISITKQIFVLVVVVLIWFSIIEGISQIKFMDDRNRTIENCVLKFQGSEIYQQQNYEFFHQICSDQANIIRYKQPVLALQTNQHFKTFNINEFGFRGPEINQTKSSGTYRIFMLGGSTTEGVGASSDETTIAGFLQKRFDDANLDRPIEVINAGIGSSDSLNEISLIKNKILDFSPDMIIAYSGWNDATHSYDEHLRNYEYIDYEESIDSIVKRHLKIFYIIHHVTKNLGYELGQEKSIGEICKIANCYVSEKLDLWKNRWQEICILGKEKNFETVIVLQPVLGTTNNTLSDYEKNELEQTTERDVLPFYYKFREKLVELNMLCSKTIDLFKVFDGLSIPIFYDSGHMGDRGNKIISNEIFQQIISIDKLNNS